MLRSWQSAAWTLLQRYVRYRFLDLKWCCIKFCKMMQGVHPICTGSFFRHVRHGFISLFSSNNCHLGDLHFLTKKSCDICDEILAPAPIFPCFSQWDPGSTLQYLSVLRRRRLQQTGQLPEGM
jgi:hypothetical protein